MYPLNMKLVDGPGFAVANDEAEHKALTENGYGPAFVAAPASDEASTKGGKKKAAE